MTSVAHAISWHIQGSPTVRAGTPIFYVYIYIYISIWTCKEEMNNYIHMFISNSLSQLSVWIYIYIYIHLLNVSYVYMSACNRHITLRDGVSLQRIAQIRYCQSLYHTLCLNLYNLSKMKMQIPHVGDNTLQIPNTNERKHSNTNVFGHVPHVVE